MTAQEFLSRLGGVTVAGDGKWMARCPAHKDGRPSLSVSGGQDGRVLVNCFAGCTPEAVVAAVDLGMADLMPARLEKPKAGKSGRIVATYPYHDENGALLFEVVRFEPKDFRQRRPDPSARDGWAWSIKGVRRVLFRLPEVLAAVGKGLPIWVTEGEKDALAMVSKGQEATCNPCGAIKNDGDQKWLPSYTETLRGAHVVVVADKDDPGRKHAQNVAAHLRGAAASVRVIEVPDVNGTPCKDAADFIGAGGEIAELIAIADETLEWAPRVEPSDPLPGNEEPDTGSTITAVASPISLGAAKRIAEDDDAMLFRRRVAKRGESWMIAAPTGIGKSVIDVQMAINFALGREFLGFEPVRPLTSLLFVAEDDEDEMAWFRDGIFHHMNLSQEERAEVGARVHFVPSSGLTSADFVNREAAPAIQATHAEVIHLNPALAYIGCEASDQKQVAAFLRGQWKPLLDRAGACSFVIHHTPKQSASSRKAEAGKFQSDYSYAGFGSVEWPNFVRGILVIEPTATAGLFRMIAPKRGTRLDWRGLDEKPTSSRFIKHATTPGTLGWEDVAQNEVPKTGRSKSPNSSPEKVLALLAKNPLATTDWQKLASDELGVGKTTFYEIRAELEDSGRIYRSPMDDLWKIKNQPSKP